MPAKKKTKKTSKSPAKAKAKKSAPRKGAEQKAPIEVTIEKKVYGEIPEKYHFFLNDGRKLKSIYELIDAFDSMSDEVFHYHVNDAKNDFAAWIKDVVDEEHLAKEIEKVESQVEAQLKLLKHVVKDLTK